VVSLPLGREHRVSRSVCFGCLSGLTLTVFWAPLRELLRFSLQREEYSHLVLVPLASVCLLILERGRVFSQIASSKGPGWTLVLIGGAWYTWIQFYGASVSENDRLFLSISPIILVGLGEFLLCYGSQAFRAGLFPLLFLFLMAPIPDALLEHGIYWLRVGSAEISEMTFQLLGVPVLRTGFVMALPGMAIEIAQECSGIRSSLGLMIVSLLAGHLFLRSAWSMTILTLATIPLLIIKNGMRIVTLSLLSIYVDPSFLTGSLHRSGGVLFFVVVLVAVFPLLWWLRRYERRAFREDSACEVSPPRRTIEAND